MLRSDFDNHPLWGVLNNLEDQLKIILDEHQPDELPQVERIRMQLDYVRGFDVVASTRAAFFHPSMLSNVQSVWEQAYSHLSASASGSASFRRLRAPFERLPETIDLTYNQGLGA